MTDLKPCPFCGGAASITRGPPGCAFVQCHTCNAASDDRLLEEAIAAWNRRSSPPVAISEEMVERALKAAQHAWSETVQSGFVTGENWEAAFRAGFVAALPHLSAAPAMGDQPVAWGYWHDGQMDGDGHPIVSATRSPDDAMRREPWTEQPLYAAAPTAPEKGEQP